MRILVDLAELEALSRLFEQNTTELAGITIDLRQRLSSDLLTKVAAYGLPTRAVAYESERIRAALTAHVSELERFTMELERVWGEAKGLVTDGRLAPGVTASASDLWWFRDASSASGAHAGGSMAFAAATSAAAHPDVAAVAVVASDPSGGSQASGATGWPALDVVVTAAGIRHNPPASGQSYRPGSGTTSWHAVEPGGHARDFGTLDSDAFAVSRLFRPLAQGRPDLIPELFGADGIGFDEGSSYQAPGHTGNHTHVAIRQGVTADAILAALKSPQK